MFDDIFDEMKRIQKEFDRVFSEFSKQMRTEELREASTDISETEDKVIVKIDMPGVDKDKIDLVVNENSISVKAERKEFKEESDKNFYKKERSYRGFNVYRTLPVKVKPETATAKYEDGVLRIEIEKAEKEKKGKKVKVA
jgi:HSP20 family protein